MIGERVPAALAGERLDRVVALLADVSRSVAAATVAAGGVRVDGEPVTSGKVRLDEGALVEVDPSAIPRTEPPTGDASVQFEVVFEDDDVVVVDKPAGLVVHPGAGNPNGTLVNGLLHRFGALADVGDPIRPGIVHRLDAGSSGLLVVARTDGAARRLIEQFASHTAGRRYDAVTWGHPGRGARHRRRADRARPVRPAADGGGRRRQSRPARSTRSPLASRRRRRWLGCRAGCRPGARTRSGSTWQRSATRSSATRPTASAARRSGCHDRSCTPPSCPSTTRRPASGCSSPAPSPTDLATFLAGLR